MSHRPRGWQLVRAVHLIGEAVRQIAAHRLRTGLAISGIAVGVAAVVGSLSLVDAFASLSRAGWERLGGARAGVVFARDSVFTGGRRIILSKVYPLTEEDHAALLTLLPELETISPSVNIPAVVSTPRLTLRDINLFSTGSEYPGIRSFTIESGRFFDQGEVERAERVIVLYRDFAAELFGDANPLGQEVFVEGERFVVIGLFRPFPGRVLRNMFIPFRTGALRLGAVRNGHGPNVWVKLRLGADKVATQDAIYKALLRRHPGSTRDHFRVLMLGEFEDRFLKEIKTQGDVVIAVALLCLIAGAVGVLNVFLISVAERTREIGLRLALGASRRGILGQILFECLVLCAIGGLSGLLLGAGIAAGAQVALRSRMKPGTNAGTVLDNDPLMFSVHVDARGILAAVTLVFATAILGGLFPAWRASRLSPSEGLRHE
ncbi:MAG: ABC transporter permease [Thermoanaerobaculia bacterium]